MKEQSAENYRYLVEPVFASSSQTLLIGDAHSPINKAVSARSFTWPGLAVHDNSHANNLSERDTTEKDVCTDSRELVRAEAQSLDTLQRF